MAFPSVEEFVQLDLGTWQLYGLFFLMGSFVVATLSDLRHLSAQREFVEVWFLFVLAILLLELHRQEWAFTTTFGIKWGLIVLLGILSWVRVGVLFRLATGDVAACMAAASLLSPGFVVLFWVLLRLAAWIEAPLLTRGRSAYPFMPVVLTATVASLGLALWGAPQLAPVE